MKLISNKTWNVQDLNARQDIKKELIGMGSKEDTNLKNKYEEWRLKYSDATITSYTSGKIYCTDSSDPQIVDLHRKINQHVGSSFIIPDKKYLIGFDETGKGEVLGHTVLVGVMFPSELYSEIERDIGNANTKIKHEISYWDGIFKKIDFYKQKGLLFFIEKVPPWQIDKYNINKLLDITYQRILLNISQSVNLSNSRVVIDDYGSGFHLKKFLSAIEKTGCKVVLQSKADDTYLESRLASIISKREQQRVLEAISVNPEFGINGHTIGSGNAGDDKTIKWLNEWKKSGKEWPWFVKRSFKTICEIDKRKVTKIYPPINDSILSKDFIEKFTSGKLDITSLSVVCPSCEYVCKSIRIIPKDAQTTPVCINCKKEIGDIFMTLQYYCGRIIVDNSIISKGCLSKDLEGRRLFENFTFFIHPVTRYESDKHPGGKKEIQKIGEFSSMGRIKFQFLDSELILDYTTISNTQRDDLVIEAAIKNNAILITADNNMKGIAQSKGCFVIEA